MCVLRWSSRGQRDSTYRDDIVVELAPALPSWPDGIVAALLPLRLTAPSQPLKRGNQTYSKKDIEE